MPKKDSKRAASPETPIEESSTKKSRTRPLKKKRETDESIDETISAILEKAEQKKTKSATPSTPTQPVVDDDANAPAPSSHSKTGSLHKTLSGTAKGKVKQTLDGHTAASESNFSAASRGRKDSKKNESKKMSSGKTSIAGIFNGPKYGIFKHPSILQKTGSEAARSASTSKKSEHARESSPDPSPEEILGELKGKLTSEPHATTRRTLTWLPEHYLNTANNLHERNTTRLQQAYSVLEKRLDAAINRKDRVSSQKEKQAKTLFAPLGEFQIRSKHRNPNDDSVHFETKSVNELVTQTESQLRGFEENLANLWKGWETTSASLSAIYWQLLQDGDGENDGRGDNKSFTLTSLMEVRGTVLDILEDAEKEVDELSEAAIAAMKDVEKVRVRLALWELHANILQEFRKATLSDLHVFFQSIDEP